MNLKQLQIYKTVVEQGTMSQAAKTLHMSQPPLSLQIKQLEVEIGAPLLIRGSRHVECTELGDFLYHRACTICDLVQNTKQELFDQQHAKTGTIHLGIVSSLQDYVLDTWLHSFIKMYPKIHYEIFEGNTYTCLDAVRHHIIEIAVVRSPFPKDSSLQMIQTAMENFYTIGSTKPLTVEELNHVPLIIYRRWKEFFDQLLETPNYFCVSDDARTCMQWAQRGYGIGLAPASIAKKEDNAYPIQDLSMQSNICIVTSKNNYISNSAKALLDYIKNQ